MSLGRKAWTIAAVASVLIALLLAPAALKASLETNRINDFQDFGIFYRAALALRHRSPAYQASDTIAPNLAPPHVLAAIVPLTFLALPIAYYAWLALSGLCLVFVGVRISQELRFEASTALTVTVVALVLSSGLVMSAISSGNIYAVLAVPMVEAWAAWRRRNDQRAAIWLGVVAAAKVLMLAPLLWLVVRGRYKAAAILVASTGIIFAGGILLFGHQEYLDWISILRRAPMAGQFHDAAFLQALMRATSGDSEQYQPFTPLPLETVHMIWAVVAGLMLSATAMIRRDSDRTFLALVSSAIFLAPIGWIHAAWWLVPPAVAVALTGGATVRIALAACAFLLWLPDTAPLWGQPSPWLTISWGSLNAWVVLVVWIVAMSPRRRSAEIT